MYTSVFPFNFFSNPCRNKGRHVYSRLIYCLCFGTLAFSTLAFSPLLSAEMVKWTDEKGQIHYGDTVPKEYRTEAETVELKEAPTLGMSDEEIKALENKTNAYQMKIERERLLQERHEQYEAYKNSQKPRTAASPPPSKTPLTREQCRDTHPTKTIDRVRCFNEAAND
ncbi:DUF4124 domain-containing protein [Teredinibacter purpureus]|uniref:DUF4124 domain-containing protein n=1 Tax=Teredinibacter purpureus TaxID=2731756 RepID=UPI000696B03B|nr:DUF4124 domain-containing protein [Teredinibacter purpureus]